MSPHVSVGITSSVAVKDNSDQVAVAMTDDHEVPMGIPPLLCGAM